MHVNRNEVRIEIHLQRLEAKGSVYILHVIGIVLKVGFKKALFPGCSEE